MLVPVIVSTFSCKMANYSAIITLFPICGANLSMIMTPPLAAIDTDTTILVVLGCSWISCEISSSLLCIRIGIAWLVIVDDIY